MGATYNKLGMPQQALTAHQQSLEYFKKNNNVVGLGIAYNNIGGAYYNLKDYNKAIENYSKSLEVKRKLNDKRGTAVSLSNMCEAYLMVNDLAKAKRFGHESLAIAEEIKSLEQVKVASELLSKIYERSRDFGKALEFERKMSQAKDSLFSADKTAQISKMRAIYETEKAEQATTLARLEADIQIARSQQERNMFIAVVSFLIVVAGMIFYLYRQKQKSNQLLSEKNVLIEKSLHERETLLKEIHHRVKNNLQIISSLLSLQSKSLQDTGAQGAISESRNRVKSMSLIHEQLYQENTISGVDMKDYVERLVKSLIQSYGVDTERVQVEIDADQLLLDVDSAIPLGLIMNELVSNSMKYAFPQQRSGSISVSLHEAGSNELHLAVRDDGVGIDPSQQREDSFGLSMVRSLMRKLKADMNVSNGKGTSVELIIRDFRKVTFAP
jgi:two-component sensor histidine kinase